MHGIDESGDLVEFAFESEDAEDVTPAVAARLARQTWSSNVRLGLTGELRLEDGRFTQVVEGRCVDVLRLVARILADSRHGAIRVTAFRALAARRHTAWTVSGFDLGAVPDATPLPTAANLRFLQARAAAQALERGLPAS